MVIGNNCRVHSWEKHLDIRSTTLLLRNLIIVTNRKAFEKLIAKLCHDISVIEYYMWKDGKAIFSTNTRHLRRLLNNAQAASHVNIVKWSTAAGITINTDRACRIICQPYLPSKESCFAWEVLFRTLATNKWRFPMLPDWHEDKESKRCTLHMTEGSWRPWPLKIKKIKFSVGEQINIALCFMIRLRTTLAVATISSRTCCYTETFLTVNCICLCCHSSLSAVT